MINFFDALIGQFQDFISPYPGKSSIYQPNLAWPDAGYSEVILGKESAYELDGIGFLMATEQPVTGDTDTITVAGADLPGIKKKSALCPGGAGAGGRYDPGRKVLRHVKKD